MDSTYQQLTGITGFLNGQEGLHEQEEKLLKKLELLGKATLAIDDLFEHPEKLREIVKCDNLVMSTTGMYADKLEMLLEAFDKLSYAPKKVIFMSENTALAFCGTARELKAKYATKFYYPDMFGNYLFELTWI